MVRFGFTRTLNSLSGVLFSGVMACGLGWAAWNFEQTGSLLEVLVGLERRLLALELRCVGIGADDPAKPDNSPQHKRLRE